MSANGYTLVDCKGMNLLSQSSQTIDGLYAASAKAVELGKPIIAINCEYGEGVPMTPIAVMAIVEDDTIVFTASILQIRVSSDDSVEIVPLITPNEAKKTTRKTTKEE